MVDVADAAPHNGFQRGLQKSLAGGGRTRRPREIGARYDFMKPTVDEKFSKRFEGLR